MNGSWTNWKILPSPSEKNLPLRTSMFFSGSYIQFSLLIKNIIYFFMSQLLHNPAEITNWLILQKTDVVIFLLHCNLWLPLFPKIALNFCHLICQKKKVMTIAFLHIAFSLIAIEVWGYFRILDPWARIPCLDFFFKWKEKFSVW